jgi:hypothetical protein
MGSGERNMKPGDFENRTGLILILIAALVMLIYPKDQFIANAAGTLALVGLGFSSIGFYIVVVEGR